MTRQSAWRKCGSHLPGPSADQEAGRNPDGLGQGITGMVDTKSSRAVMFEIFGISCNQWPEALRPRIHKCDECRVNE